MIVTVLLVVSQIVMKSGVVVLLKMIVVHISVVQIMTVHRTVSMYVVVLLSPTYAMYVMAVT